MEEEEEEEDEEEEDLMGGSERCPKRYTIIVSSCEDFHGQRERETHN